MVRPQCLPLKYQFNMASSSINQQLSELSQQLADLIQNQLLPDQSDSYSNYIVESMIGSTIATLNIAPSVSTSALSNVLQTIAFPSVLAYESGWRDLITSQGTSDQIKCSMNGVSLEVFEQYFDYVFVQNAPTQVRQIVEQLEQENWIGSLESKKQVLQTVCTSEKVASLFYVASFCSPINKYPIGVMAVDPCLGFILGQWAFESSPQNGTFYETTLISNLACAGGTPISNPEQFVLGWVDYPQAVRDGAGATYLVEAFKLRDLWITNSSSPVDTNPLGRYQEGWRSRLLSDQKSHLATVVKINEELNLNTNGLFSQSQQYAEHCLQLGETYRRVLTEGGFDYTTFAAGGESTLPPVGAFRQDQAQSSVTVSKTSINNLLSLANGLGGKVNNSSNSQIVINSDRIILNTRLDYLMLFGGAGVSISSPNPVNIDSDSSVTLFGEEGVYIGLPNKGEPYNPFSPDATTNLAQATPNQEYEPLVLGSKLADWLEDLTITLRNAVVLTPTGKGQFREDVINDLAALQARLPEIKSTFGFIDGVSHESVDAEPEPLTSSEPVTITQIAPVTNQQEQEAPPPPPPVTASVQVPAATPASTSQTFQQYVSNTPWSAAFISYVIRQAGVSFPSSLAHSQYSQKVRAGGFPWKALNPSTTPVKVGDVVVKNRANNNLTFSSATWSGNSHGDIVVQVQANRAKVIGGNLGNTSKKQNVNLDNFVLANSNEGTDGSYFVILRPDSLDDAQAVAYAAEQEFINFNQRDELDPSVAPLLTSYYEEGKGNPPPYS